jgi:ketopantoate reductase
VDLQQKRETEVDYISGFLLEQARHCGITMPVQTSFLNRIKSR